MNGSSRPAKKSPNKWAKCKMCRSSVVVFHFLKRASCQVAFVYCECEDHYWPMIIKRGSQIGRLGQPFDATAARDNKSEQIYLRQVWSNDFVLAYRSKDMRKLVAYKWSSILEGDYKPLDLGAFPNLTVGNISDCMLSGFTISVLWQNGSFILPGNTGTLQGIFI